MIFEVLSFIINHDPIFILVTPTILAILEFNIKRSNTSVNWNRFFILLNINGYIVLLIFYQWEF